MTYVLVTIIAIILASVVCRCVDLYWFKPWAKRRHLEQQAREINRRLMR
jgi:hypothetical protein